MTDFFNSFADYLDGKTSPITQSVISTAKGDAQTRMQIYQNAYISRLVDILADDFAAIYQILGTEAFVESATAYLRTYPSTSFSVRYFGQHFAKFLSETPPYAEYTYLGQLADFEWSKGVVFDAPDSEIFTLEQLPSIPPDAWESATFSFIPAMKRLTYNYNVPQIWQALQNSRDDEPLPAPTALASPLAWVMWRKDLNPNWYSMGDIEDNFFVQARRGKSFGELCEQLSHTLNNTEEAAQQSAQFVRRWIEAGLLVSINS